MHTALLICIILEIITFIAIIIYGIKDSADVSDIVVAIFVVNVILIGAIGFGAICSVPSWTEEYQKISPDKVEMSIHQNNGIVVYSYDKILYNSHEIINLNAVKNIDYYQLVISYNAYHGEVSKNLYPVEKGKIDDYIKEKWWFFHI